MTVRIYSTAHSDETVRLTLFAMQEHGTPLDESPVVPSILV